MRISLSLGLLFLASLTTFAQEPNARSAIRAKAGDSEIVITTTARVAGAIDSLTWGGKEFIDSTDHGRQLQSASNLDCGKEAFNPEVFNPTEAGSRADSAGPTSSSKLLKLDAQGNELRTTNQMAFWLKPGEESGGFPALNRTILSNHLLAKHVRIGCEGLPHAIEYVVTFTLPADEKHTRAQFETLTGYMPPEFSQFWRFDPAQAKLLELSYGPGEQEMPVVLATPDGKYAMGIFAPPDQPGADGFPKQKPSYGRWWFVPERVVKWNCVFRVRDPKPGEYTFRMFVAVGSLEDVRQALAALVKHTPSEQKG